MLMIPPALQTKSGAHRIPRSASAASSESSASWLLAAPAIALQRSAGTVSSLSTPPSAHGATRSTSAVIALERVRPVARRARRPARAWTGRRRRRRAPRRPRAASRASRPPTLPSPITAIRRPSRSSVPNARSQRRRGPRPRSPAPSTGSGRRSRSARPVTCLVRVGDDLHVRLAGADVLGGQVVAAERLDGVAEVLQHGLAALRRRARASSGRSMITPLPPPSGRPATAALKVIARDSRSTSRTAARESS